MTLAERLALARETAGHVPGCHCHGSHHDPVCEGEEAKLLAVIEEVIRRERHAWHARFVECTAHNEWCPFLPVAQQTRCTCGTHMRLAETLAELAAAARAEP